MMMTVETSVYVLECIGTYNIFFEMYNMQYHSFYLWCFFRIDVSKLKKKKKMRSGRGDVVSNVQENCVDSSAEVHSPKHHSVSKTDKKQTEMAGGQQKARKKRNKTVVETAVANCEDDAASEVEEKHQKNLNRNVESLNSDLCSQPQRDQQSKSGIAAICC